MIELDISFENDEIKASVAQDDVSMIVEKVLDYLKLGNCELSLSFVSKESMRVLNEQYRNKNESTDVLSFAQQDDDEQFFKSERLTLLGDIVISLDDMQANCEIFNVSFDEELKRLIVHGILHLVGEDHTSNNDDEPMLKRQEEIMKFLLKGSV